MEHELNGTFEENNEKMVVVRIFSNNYWSTLGMIEEHGESIPLELYPHEGDLGSRYSKEMDNLLDSFNEDPVEKIRYCDRSYELWAFPYHEDEVAINGYYQYKWWLEEFITEWGFSKDSIRSTYDYQGYGVPLMDYACGNVICMVALKITEEKYNEIKSDLEKKYSSVGIMDYENN
ncbi:hypothetical protein MmarC5_0631 [Methanococcus maripaludis C5]|uniref:Uncharacterized protein n=1 Tax=Methanococcus maripaludis (strain C5 / ATCC BAA-1333) TaxID=402880 RepID=A4FXK9_METM5|nr:hypothetical protein [Methanococcus maripaludis]ABO34943.1 hypothetical protein MmarC5_0631 [Methanococcus maripaludis C5]